ncbi:hypothetical protein [Usitatibacter palustris]|uniref:HEAT repeat-containing protein n=1 Tax=Usitatibacter palustris TaxID=2732487 RepID=A0A6M4H256_9PROT|nr:hypothetical protein [Usitatibacter palustris]QJR13432.1 hypothetical protein DSM104440_00215 [Usitatibacter palustris]
MRSCFLLLLAAAFALPASAAKTTVCSITVNSADEREAFRSALPADRYDFVELVEHGRPDWLASACTRGVQCDVLVVSGHFAGTEFYTSRFDRSESLPVEEMERAVCSQSCPGVFSKLKEVYLFGCDTLKPDPVRTATPEVIRGYVRSGSTKAEAERAARELSERHGESSRALMRQLFADVPVIYGFATFAPFGRTAGPMLARHFESGYGVEIGSGTVSPTLLARFSNTGMVVTEGRRASDAEAGARRDACRYYDDRLTTTQKLRSVHDVLSRDPAEVRMAFPRIEKFLASPGLTADPAFALALGDLARDRAVAGRFLALTRATEDPQLRLRMIALARNVGWLSAAEQSAEQARLVRDVLTAGDMGFDEVDLVCTLGRERAVDVAQVGVKPTSTLGSRPAPAAALACLGSRESRERMLRTLASADENDVRIAQAYFRHRPIATGDELVTATRAVARMKPSAAQVRAIETLARHHLSDRQVIDELTRLYTRTTSANIQRAVAEAFLRADAKLLADPELVSVLRRHRVRAPDGARDLVDVLLERLQLPA